MIKKQISILLTVAMVVAAVSGCGREKTNSSAEEQNREDAQDTEGMTDIFEPESEESELKVVCLSSRLWNTKKQKERQRGRQSVVIGCVAHFELVGPVGP